MMLKMRSMVFSVGVSSRVASLYASVMQLRPMRRMMKPSKYLLLVTNMAALLI